MYDEYEYIINKDINICFFSGTVISEPQFNFFYNSKKLISKTEFWLNVETGFESSKTLKPTKIKMTAYNETSDFVYKKLDIGDRIMIKGFIEKERVIIEDVFFKI